MPETDEQRSEHKVSRKGLHQKNFSVPRLQMQKEDSLAPQKASML